MGEYLTKNGNVSMSDIFFNLLNLPCMNGFCPNRIMQWLSWSDRWSIWHIKAYFYISSNNSINFVLATVTLCSTCSLRNSSTQIRHFSFGETLSSPTQLPWELFSWLSDNCPFVCIIVISQGSKVCGYALLRRWN